MFAYPVYFFDFVNVPLMALTAWYDSRLGREICQ
jgi:hypothetical protein